MSRTHISRDIEELSAALFEMLHIQRTDRTEQEQLSERIRPVLERWSIGFDLIGERPSVLVTHATLPQSLQQERNMRVWTTVNALQPSIPVIVAVPGNSADSEARPDSTLNLPPRCLVYLASGNELLPPSIMILGQRAFRMQRKEDQAQMSISYVTQFKGSQDQVLFSPWELTLPSFDIEPAVKHEVVHSGPNNQLETEVHTKLLSILDRDNLHSTLLTHCQNCDLKTAAAVYEGMLQCALSKDQENWDGKWEFLGEGNYKDHFSITEQVHNSLLGNALPVEKPDSPFPTLDDLSWVLE